MKNFVIPIISVVVLGMGAVVSTTLLKSIPPEDNRQPPPSQELRTPQPSSSLPEQSSPDEAYRGEMTPILTQKLSNALGRPASYELTMKREAATWTLLCGRPLEPGGEQFNYARSNVKQQFLDAALENQFCALLRQYKDGHEIVAYDLGSLDSPMGAWRAKFDLPASLFE